MRYEFTTKIWQVRDDLTNRYTSIADANLSYNAAGDLIKDKDSYEYEYDYENRIVKITKDGNDIAEFAYDALASRVEKKDLIDPNNTRRYYYNYNLPRFVIGGGWQVLTEYNGSGVFKQWYAYGNYIDEVLAKGTTPWPISTMFYIHDHLYSPAALTNYWGTVLERYEYDAYGNCHVLEPNFAPDSDGRSNYGNPYLFTGRRVDILDSGSLKIQYNRNRYYDYYTGRWLTHDPLGITPNCRKPNEFMPFGQYEDSLNLYEMMGSNPLMGTDPWGLWEPIGGARLGGWYACRYLRSILSRIMAIRRLLLGLGFPVAIRDGHPYQHCLWSCNMTRGHGRVYAITMGILKEDLDKKVADLADMIPPCMWKWTITIPGWGLSDWVCSAGQTADDKDNEAGWDCGDKPQYKHLDCAECCKTRMNIWPHTKEGTVERPFGPRCQGRYRKQVEKNRKGKVEVEDPK